MRSALIKKCLILEEANIFQENQLSHINSSLKIISKTEKLRRDQISR